MKFYAATARIVCLLFVPVILVAASHSASAQEEKKKAEDAASQEDLFKVPDGTPEELLQYIQKLDQEEPPETTLPKMQKFQEKQQEAILQAADKIFAAKPDKEQLEQAAVLKAAALNRLAQIDDKYQKQLEALPEELKKAGHPELAHDMEAFLLEREVLQLREATPKELEKLLGRVRDFLGEGTLDEQDVRLAIRTARTIEGRGNTELAAKAYRELGKLLAKSEEAQIAELGAKLEGTARRMDLVGNSMELDGVTMEGKPLDWPKYRGKVALVMFWATWCGPCRREITHVLDVYKEYHDRGFEVVGISVDESREDLEEFLKENEIPWKIVFDQARSDSKKGEPMSVRYGVMGIPEAVLVDRKGKVVATGVRGPELDRQLKEMIGSGEEKTEKKAG